MDKVDAIVMAWVRRGEYYRYNLSIDSIKHTTSRDFRCIIPRYERAYFTKPNMGEVPDAVPYDEEYIEREVLLQIDVQGKQYRVGVGYGALTKTMVIFDQR